MTTDKIYLCAQQLLEDSFRLGASVVASGFRPSLVVALWRGGMPIGIAVQELLAYAGIETDSIAIRTSSYSGIDQRSPEVRIDGMESMVRIASHSDSLLIVDDVFDTGLTVDAVISQLQDKAGPDAPHDIRVAVPYFKPARNLTARTPDYYLHQTDDWLVYPHSLEGLSVDEIVANRPALYEIISAYLPG